MRVNLAPDGLVGVDVGEASLLDELELRANPDCAEWHVWTGDNVAHLYV